MLKVIIRSVKDQWILDDGEWLWIQYHLNQPLDLSSLTFDSDGEVMTIAIRTHSACNAVIVLFIEINEVEYQFVGELNKQNYMEEQQ